VDALRRLEAACRAAAMVLLDRDQDALAGVEAGSYQAPSQSIPLRVIDAELSLAEVYDKLELSR
jgi:hypothetical protein